MSSPGSPANPVVGIAHCGDLGSAIARILRAQGVRVVTTCSGRSLDTRSRAEASGAEILSSFADVVAQSEWVLSLVLPAAAEEVAREYADLAHLRPRNSTFVDANSIDPETMSRIADQLGQRGIPVIDATVHGGAQRLSELGVLYASGPSAHRLESLFRGAVRVRCLGDQSGLAKRMKILIAGFSKSLNALFLEIALLAHRGDMLEPFLESFQHFYAGILAPIERMLPTYPQHAARRVGELQSIQHLAESSGAPHGMLDGAAEMIRFISAVDWNQQRLCGDATDTAEIVRQVAAHGPITHSK